jgi:type III secretory pathway lipoprotein EscJ
MSRNKGKKKPDNLVIHVSEIKDMLKTVLSGLNQEDIELVQESFEQENITPNVIEQ